MRQVLAAAFLRAFAIGATAVLLGITLATRGFSAADIGSVVAAGLVGTALASAWLGRYGSRLPTVPTLTTLALVAAAGTAAVALLDSPLALHLAFLLGMVNGAGRDRGASLVLEQAILPSLLTDASRTRGYAWYNVAQDAGHAVGALAAALPSLLEATLAWPQGQGARVAFLALAALLAASAALYRTLPRTLSHAARENATVIPRESRRIVRRISALFFVDSLAGGFLGTALLSYFFFERFGASEAAIAALFFGARTLNALSHLGAAWLARRIGLVNTMVFTHIPSSLLLVTVGLTDDFGLAAVLFLLREGLVEMDVPTRQSYVMAVVAPEARTYASSVTNLVRLAGWAAGPAFAGVLMTGTGLATPLYVGAAMKIGYDLALWRAFRHLRPPEER